jgi:hypothetical protein
MQGERRALHLCAWPQDLAALAELIAQLERRIDLMRWLGDDLATLADLRARLGSRRRNRRGLRRKGLPLYHRPAGAINRE